MTLSPHRQPSFPPPIPTGDGGTDEQRAVLAAVVSGFWERPDLDLTVLEPLGPDEVGAHLPGPLPRRCLRELVVLLELCRHPLTDEQVTRVDASAAALHEDGPGLHLARTLVRDGTARALVESPRDRDVRADVVQLTTARGWRLLELHQVGMSLEEVFIRVVAGEQDSDTLDAMAGEARSQA